MSNSPLTTMQWEYFYQPPIWQLLAAFTCQINWHRACVFRSPESARELRTCNKCWWRSMDRVHLARNWEINLMDPFGSRCLQPSPHAEKCQISPALTTLPMRSSNKKLIRCALSKQALSFQRPSPRSLGEGQLKWKKSRSRLAPDLPKEKVKAAFFALPFHW